MRQIRKSSADVKTTVTQKIVNEEVIENREQILQSEIRRLRHSIKKNSDNEQNIALYQQNIAVLMKEVLQDDINSKRVGLQNDELYKRLKTSENQNQNLI